LDCNGTVADWVFSDNLTARNPCNMKTTTATMVIEPAESADEPAIRALLRQSGLPDEDFAAHLPHFLVARHSGNLVGTVGFELHGTDALLRSLAVAPDWQGDGLGGALVRRLEDEARRVGVRCFYLLTTTAEKFFARRWFRTIPRDRVPPAIAATPEFQGLCPATAVCMARSVKP
jgi:amino-acid N-acetyltransferase